MSIRALLTRVERLSKEMTGRTCPVCGHNEHDEIVFGKISWQSNSDDRVDDGPEYCAGCGRMIRGGRIKFRGGRRVKTD